MDFVSMCSLRLQTTRPPLSVTQPQQLARSGSVNGDTTTPGHSVSEEHDGAGYLEIQPSSICAQIFRSINWSFAIGI
jgi:hypothetical protein